MKRPTPTTRRVVAETLLPCVRTGWRGVWDAIQSAVTGKPVRSLDKPHVLSMYITTQPDAEVGFFINGVMLEGTTLDTDKPRFGCKDGGVHHADA